MKPSFFTEISSPIVCEYKSDSWIADHRTPFHFHDGYEILIFFNGNASFCIGQHEQFLTPGTVICCAPFSLHRALPHDPHNYDRILLHIRKDTLLSLSSTFTDLSTCFHSSSQPIYSFSKPDLDNIVALCKKLEGALHTQSFGCDVLQTAILTELLVLLNQKSVCSKMSVSNHMPPLVTEIFHYIDEHFTEDITVSHLANTLHHNADYLTRSFRKVANCSIRQYLILKRIQHAGTLLSQGATLTDACFASGFQTYSHFSKTFSAHFGISPKNYQQKYWQMH